MEMQPLRRVIAQAALVASATAVLALAFNAVRQNGLPLVARTPYEVLVPCPEPGGAVTSLEPGDPVVDSPRTFLIDARLPKEAPGHEHLPAAINVPYDWLDPLPEAELAKLVRAIAASHVTRVVVYGDGERPDSGEYLGREISGRGIKNVSFVRGGAPALLDARRP
jgi:hypothetical protein